MSTNDEEPQTPGGPYTGWSVEELEKAQRVNRINLDAHRGIRDQIKAELKIAREREAGEARPIPENPGWTAFAFNFQLAGDGLTRSATCGQSGGEIAVTSGDMYWFFMNWEELILWMRDTEQVKAVSRIWKLVAPINGTSVTVR